MSETIAARSVTPEVGRLTLAELLASLKAGIWDFRRAPLYGLFFSSFYVIVGFGLIMLGAGTFVWTLALSLGFPLVAPFAAVGLYEVSRRLEADLPLDWGEILGVVLRERGRQLPWMGAILLIIFLFWSFFAHMLFALMMGLSAMTNISSSWESLMTPMGLSMILAEGIVGAGVAYFAFAISVVSFPLLLDREIDFVSAMLLSLKAVRRNPVVMTVWAGIIALSILVAMIPLFLGLFVVLPVLGHATWHIYRRVLYAPV